MTENPSESPKLTTPEEVVALMKSSRTAEEWGDNCKRVKADFGGYPKFWYATILLSGLAEKTLNGFEGTDEVAFEKLGPSVDEVLDS
ncbi:hypothetical protein ACFL21_04500 [Patescibacteria group bacterium]